ncbi:MAG: SDR family NAD(P)-dependent oxidoreductase [Polyangiaceae bacterium]|nr:SDR family NAD(P)-dependent oxidoreductase [Polyangiaceae bacterium]
MNLRALVTGASSGIGSALSRRLARRGYEVWLAARRLPELEAEARAIESEGGRAHAVALDVSRPEETEGRVAALDREVGGFDLVVANAGIGGRQKPVAKQTFSDFREVMEVNLLGAAATILPLVPGMVERGRGHIVGVSSLAGEIPLPAGADYGTSKAALSFFLASAAADLIPRGVFVTDVHPGFVKTPLTAKNKFPMPFLVELEDAARIIDRAIEKKKRVVRFPAPLSAAISGGSLLPAVWRDALVNKNRPI